MILTATFFLMDLVESRISFRETSSLFALLNIYPM